MATVRSLATSLVLTLLLAFCSAWSIGSSAQAKPTFVDDESFGNRGLVTGMVGPLNLSATLGPEVFARDGHGRVIVGSANGPTWRVWRILPNGDLDRSFGDKGEFVTSKWGPYDLTVGSPASPPLANLTSAVIRPDGRILLVGYVGSYPSGDIRKGSAFMVMAQLMADGSPDMSFGQDGTIWAGGTKGATQVTLRPDGSFLVGAFRQISRTGKTDDGWLFSYTAGGRMDRDFGPRRGANGVSVPGAPRKPSYVFDVEVLRGGRILVTGVMKNRVVVMRLRKDGSRDDSFGKRGQTILLPGGKMSLAAAARDLERDRKGRIVLSGFVYPKDSSTAGYGIVMRLRSNGTVDRSFGENGIVRLYATALKRGRSTRLYDLSLDSRGGIWVTGSAGRSARKQRRAIAVRYLPNGRKDGLFFKRGILNIRLGDGSSGSAVTRAGRKMYMSGRYDHNGQERFFLKRLVPHR